MKKMSKKTTALAGLGVLAVVGGTFAYYNEKVSLENPLTTGKYENELIEDYTPPTDDLKPGATINKDVGAKNTGDYPVLVRIKMDEVWRRNGDTNGFIKHSSKVDAGNTDEFAAIEIGAEGGYEDEFIATQSSDTDGQVNGDDSVVRKNLTENYDTNWTYNPNDGYWYYNNILYSGHTTGKLLDSITLASNVDLGKYIQKDWYYIGDAENADGIGEEDWIEYWVTRKNGAVTGIEVMLPDPEDNDKKVKTSVTDTNEDGFIDAIDMASVLELGENDKLFRKNESLLDEKAKGYADANYTLTITSEFVQATPGALAEVFGNIDLLPTNIKNVIEGIQIDDLDLNRAEDTTSTESESVTIIE